MTYDYFRRFVDVLVSMLLLVALIPIFVMVAIAIRLDTSGPVLFISKRNGKNNKQFAMYKFRTMRSGTPEVATEMLKDAQAVTTYTGQLLRSTSLDELPQLVNVVLGQMSLIGPRPALIDQACLIKLRSNSGIDQMLPGITGWAQVNGRDSITLEEKVALERYYLKHKSWSLDMTIALRTVSNVARRVDVADGMNNDARKQ